MEPIILKPFSDEVFADIKRHVTEVRRLFDWPGIPYHDATVPENQPSEQGTVVGNKFNRWHWHRPPLLHALHHSADLIGLADDVFQSQLKPSYVFLSMYGPEGICPLHTDRPQCQYTIDLQINSNGDWPININGEDYVLKDGEAIAYSGTKHPHFRKSMHAEKLRPCTKMDLAFFHFVPIDWMGKVD